MASSEQIALGASMTEWVVSLKAAGFNSIADQIDDNKLRTLHRLGSLGLPTAAIHIASVTDFLENPDEHCAELSRDEYFVILAPNTDEAKRRYRTRGIRGEEISSFIEQSLEPQSFNTYSLVMQEKLQYYYGGNIVCNTSGAVWAEVVEGSFGHNQLVSGETPHFTASRDEFSGRFTYSFENPELRQAIWRTISAIPHTTDSESHAPEYSLRGAKFLTGYYEFYLARRSEAAALEPIFIDYSDQPAFLPKN